MEAPTSPHKPHLSPLAILIAILVIIVGGCGAVWLNQPPSSQELLANYAKAEDFLKGIKSVGGLPWWTPHFLQGTSLAPTWSFMVTNLVMLFFSVPFGYFVGPKLAILACVVFGSLGSYGFISSYSKDRWCGLAAGVLFLFCPSLIVRLAGFEHFVVVCSMALLPYAFWAVLALATRPSLATALLAGATYAVVALSYGKTSLMALPSILLFAVVQHFGRPASQRAPARLILLAAVTFVVLAVIPNLPALRETGFITVFEFAPFQGWQSSFSTKSAMGWVDRDAILSTGMLPNYNPTASNGGTYLGIISFLALAMALVRRDLTETPWGRRARLFLILGLLGFWLSFGPRNVLFGHLTFLALSFGAADFVPAIGWLFIAIQIWVIFRLIPRQSSAWLYLGIITSLIYLLVPGFRILELVPLYRDIRAPFDFYHITGAVCMVFAAALVIPRMLALLSSRTIQVVAAAAIFFVGLLDSAPYARPLFNSSMSAIVFEDFVKAQDFLKASTLPGRVHAISGRYFYLLTPLFSGRSLNSEAFNSYLQQRGAALLQAGSSMAPQFLNSYFNISGVTYILIDKSDPELSPEFQDRFSAQFKNAFENTNFRVLENPTSLGEAFFAQDFITSSSGTSENSAPVLAGVGFNLATIEQVGSDLSKPGLQGKIVDGRISQINKGKLTEGKTFDRLQVTPGSNRTYQEVTFTPPANPGWLINTEAYHPDWKAYQSGSQIPIARAFVALQGVWTDSQEPVTFRFEQPFWYSLCILVSGMGWFACFSMGLLALTPFRKTLFAAATNSRVTVAAPFITRSTLIARPVVIIPTWNEIEGIANILEMTLTAAPACDVLVVDDNSPDGTPAVVKAHAEFGKRLHLLERKGKLGLGSAYREGFKWAISKGYDACIEMDADLSHNPEDIPRLIDTLNKGADAAIGSRYLDGVRVINWPEHRLLLSTMASRYVRFVTKLPLTDATSGFKALRCSALEDLDWGMLRAEGYAFQIELHFALWRRGCTIKEIPIIFTERRSGITKMNISIAIEAVLRVMALGWERLVHPQSTPEEKEPEQ